MKFRFCPECGEALINKEIGDEDSVPFCTVCSRPWFGFSYPCVICLVVNGAGEIVLLRQEYISKEHPVLVSGYIQPGESAESAAAREVLEETGLTVTSARYALSCHFAKTDCLMLGFVCEAEKSGFKRSSEVDGIGWYSAGEAEKLLRPGSVGARLLAIYTGKCKDKR